MNSTITTAQPHGYEVGERLHISMHEPDPRWWMKPWYWITRKPAVRIVSYEGTVEGNTSRTITLDKWIKYD